MIVRGRLYVVLVALVLAVVTTGCLGVGPGARGGLGSTGRLTQGCKPAARPSKPGGLNISVVCQARLTVSNIETPTFDSVVFPNPLQGWVGGADCAPGQILDACSGIIEATTNGGHTWAVAYRASQPVLQLDMLDARYGFAITGRHGCSGIPAPCGQNLLATTDGGAHWSSIYQAGPSASISDVHFSGPNTGWLALRECPPADAIAPSTCPGRVLATSDGGAHWTTALSTAGPVVALTSSGHTVWALAEGTTRIGSLVPVKVLRADSTGTAWRVLANVPAGYTSDVGTVASIAFMNSSNGWLSLFQGTSCAMHGCEAAGLWHTTDGGHTWVSATPPLPGPCGSEGISFASAPGGAVYAAQRINTAACTPPATTLSVLRPSGNWMPIHSWANSSVESMAWPSPSDGWAALGNALEHSTDGGVHWSQVQPRISPTLGIASAGQTLWGAGTITDPGAVVVSHDGGKTWKLSAHLPGSITALSASGGRLWAVDWSNKGGWALYASTVGGTWAPIFKMPSNRFGQESPVSLNMFAGSGVMVATRGPSEVQPSGVGPGTYLATTDGGHGWSTKSPVPAGGLLPSASFSDPAHGWVLAERGGFSTAYALLGTTDAGRHWTSVANLASPASPPVGWAGVGRLDNHIGWLWGSLQRSASQTLGHLVIVTTKDGGKSWIRYDLPSTVGLDQGLRGPAQVVFTSPTRGWILTPNVLWSTTDGGLRWSAMPG